MRHWPRHILEHRVVLAVPDFVLLGEQVVDELGKMEVRLLNVSLGILQIVADEAGNVRFDVSQRVLLFSY